MLLRARERTRAVVPRGLHSSYGRRACAAGTASASAAATHGAPATPPRWPPSTVRVHVSGGRPGHAIIRTTRPPRRGTGCSRVSQGVPCSAERGPARCWTRR